MDVLRVVSIEGKGRGVVAGRRFAAGERIERAPVIVLDPAERAAIEQTRLFEYRYAWGEREEGAAIALGYGSLYNHSDRPNARFWRLWDERVIEFTATRDIEAGEEITIDYRGEGGEGERAPLWFEPR